MCRSIKPLRKLDPPAGDKDFAAAALQYVRKISGFQKPSRANQEAFDEAVRQIAQASAELLQRIGSGASQPG